MHSPQNAPEVFEEKIHVLQHFPVVADQAGASFGGTVEQSSLVVPKLGVGAPI